MCRLAWVSAVLCAVAVGCGPGAKGGGGGNGGGGAGGGGGGGGSGGSGGGPVEPPPVDGAFTFYGVAQGLSSDVWDVSADEAGNVYVAAGDAVYAKRRGDNAFLRFDAASANLTKNCDATGTTLCNLVSIAGAAPGIAYVGLQGIGTDGDSDPDWQLDSGGIDALSFDGAKLVKTRHVEVAGTPHVICSNDSAGPCPGDILWEKGRRKVRQVLRMAVNHDTTKIQYGDVWIAGTHGTFSLLVASPDRRGWVDRTLLFPDFPKIADRRYVWEHDHPAMSIWATINGVRRWAFLSGESTAIAIDPTTGDPWASNETRTASKRGYGSMPDGWDVGMWPPASANPADPIPSWLDVWPDPDPGAANIDSFDAMDPRWEDATTSLSFCDDGTLWIASSLHGLARRAANGSISYVSLPDGLGNNASAVACDPTDGSVWVGFGWGGFGRYNGAWWTVPSTAAKFAYQGPVRNIQIDRWANPRLVYLAHAASRFGSGGVTVYNGR